MNKEDITVLGKTGIRVVREDRYKFPTGANGTKARSIFKMIDGAKGTTTAGYRSSTQGAMTAAIARLLGIPFIYFCPRGPLTPELKCILANGKQVDQTQKHGHFRGQCDTAALAVAQSHEGWVYIPSWMDTVDHLLFVEQRFWEVHKQLTTTPKTRYVVPVGSGMTFIAILRCLREIPKDQRPQAVGIQVGQDPRKLFARYLPAWQFYGGLLEYPTPYDKPADFDDYYDIPVDPYYSAKCIEYLRHGDVFWNSGARKGLI